MELHYYHVDVFTTTPLEGNPLAVFPDATGLEAGTMQSIARELNLSETTFIIPRSRAIVERACASLLQPPNCRSPEFRRLVRRS